VRALRRQFGSAGPIEINSIGLEKLSHFVVGSTLLNLYPKLEGKPLSLLALQLSTMCFD
jgi:hypothetical protein